MLEEGTPELNDLSRSLAKIPCCVPLPEGARKSADYLYRGVVVVELKEIKIDTAPIREKLHQAIRADAGLVSTVHGMTMSQMADHTRRPKYWRRKVEQLFFRPLETHLRKAKEQVFESRKETGAPYGVVLIGIDGDQATTPDDFAVMTAKMIKQYTDRHDAQMASVSEICLFHFNHPTVVGSDYFDCQVRAIVTEHGMSDSGYQAHIGHLFDDLQKFGTFDLKFL